MASGKKKYMPQVIIDELEDLKLEHNIERDHVAMEKLADYARVGREVERLATFNFKHKPTKRPKIQRRRSIFDF